MALRRSEQSIPQYASRERPGGEIVPPFHVLQSCSGVLVAQPLVGQLLAVELCAVLRDEREGRVA